MATIRICDLHVRTIIGTHPWERKNAQDVIVNITIDYDASKASKSDNLKDALDYEAIAKKVITTIEHSKYRLLEKLGKHLLDGIVVDQRVVKASIRLDKPHAIAEAKSVSVELSR